MLDTLANLAQILSAIAVVAAIVFGVAQIRQFRQQRRDAVAVELMRSIQDVEFTRSLQLLLALPDTPPSDNARALNPEAEYAAWVLAGKYETLGYLVYCGIMPFDLVEELVGGVGVHLWTRLKPWAQDVREKQGQPLLMEWFQWLAERLEERERPAAVPAYIRVRKWNEPKSRRRTMH